MDLRILLACAACAVAGCAHFSHSNHPLAHGAGPDPKRVSVSQGETLRVGSAVQAGVADEAPSPHRATLTVDGRRGNDGVLFFLALSGGGSRAAYFSAATMLRLQTLFDDIDLLQEVDAISSVSGGSLPAAYYSLTRDEVLPLRGSLAVLLDAQDALPAGKLQIDRQRASLRCRAPLSLAESEQLRSRTGLRRGDLRRIVDLCAQAALTSLRNWEDESVRERMTRNYLVRWFFNWFWPHNIALYWLTSYDRADIMAKTFEDNLYDTPVLGTPHRMRDLNPYRPYLIINATNATGQGEDGEPEHFPFGSVFTFTEDDFRARLNSDIGRYSVARAVMGSAAFPFVFPSMTLRDYRPGLKCAAEAPSCERYLHVVDGGNSDNLGLKSIKRALFELALRGELERYERVVVLLVDAFTEPPGAASNLPDARSPISRIVDTNFVQAFDALLQANRARNVGEFHGAQLRWDDSDCDPATRSLPPPLCEELSRRLPQGLDLSSQLVFYHFGFDDVRDASLRRSLNRIPTTFLLSEAHARRIDEAVQAVLTPDNACLRQIRDVLRGEPLPAPFSRRVCRGVDVVPKGPTN